MENRPTTAQEIVEMFKGLVRPFAIGVFVLLIAVMTWEGRFAEIPLAILAATGLFGGEYSLERMVKRWRGK